MEVPACFRKSAPKKKNAVKELTSSYYDKGTLLFTIYPKYGNLVSVNSNPEKASALYTHLVVIPCLSPNSTQNQKAPHTNERGLPQQGLLLVVLIHGWAPFGLPVSFGEGTLFASFHLWWHSFRNYCFLRPSRKRRPANTPHGNQILQVER